MPYFGYGRQDRKAAGREAITAKLIADLLTTAGAQRVVAIDLHAPQIMGFFNILVDHLYASPVLLEYIRSLNLNPADIVLSVRGRWWCSCEPGAFPSSLTTPPSP